MNVHICLPCPYPFLHISSCPLFLLFLSYPWPLTETGAWAGWTFVQFQYGWTYGQECPNRKYPLDHSHTRKERKIKYNILPIRKRFAFMGCTGSGSSCDFAITSFNCWLSHSQSLPWTTSGIQWTLLSHDDKSSENLLAVDISVPKLPSWSSCIEEGSRRQRGSPAQTHMPYSQGANRRECSCGQHELQFGKSGYD